MTPKIFLANMSEPPRTTTNIVTFTRRQATTIHRRLVAAQAAAPDKLTGKVAESIKNAQETCYDNPESGECAAAWDEVEEVSAAVSHARDRKKESDPLEEYCKDNPETDECRTYDN